MAHFLTVEDQDGKTISETRYEGREEFFNAWDKATRTPVKGAFLVTSTGDGINRSYHVPQSEAPDEAPKAAKASGADRERAGDAQADAGDAATDAPAAETAKSDAKSGAKRTSLGALTSH